MAESIHEQIAVALQTAFESIADDGGTTYWYKPDAVRRISFFEDKHLAREYQYLILITPGDEIHAEEATGRCRAEMELFVLVAYQYEGVTEDSLPTRWTIINRCIRDVLRKLWEDVSLGGLALNIVEGSLVVDRARARAGWCLAELRFSISYVYPKATP